MSQGKVHFLGIGGSGASAAAAIAQAQGYNITGCDQQPFNEFTEIFDRKILFQGHTPNHLKGIDILAITPAVFSLDPNNPEILQAKQQGIKVLTWQQFMGKYLEKNKFVIAISGTHGKSTTTAMVGQLLEDAGLDPTVELGAIVPKWKANYRIGQSKYFVTEADEFNNNFLASHPDITIVTIIEMDHPEYFKDFDAYKESFKKFLGQTKEKIIANLSNPGVKQILAFHPKGVKVITDYSKQLIDFPLKVPGKYNIFNASAAFQVGLALNINPKIIQKSLGSYSGIGRRFEYLGKAQEREVYSDFAHHPTEIKVTLEAARGKFPEKNITVIFQPHMFSRTHTLFADFVRVLQNTPVDQIFILDIYPSREKDTGLVNSKQLVEAINKENVFYQSSSEQLLEKLKQEEGSDRVYFFMGAGDIHKLAQKFLMYSLNKLPLSS